MAAFTSVRPTYRFFFLQYTSSLSKRKKILSCTFPAEILSRTPCMSISVQVSVMLEPCKETREAAG